ncbi:MAG TPA: nuclear transport factor 2 family protein [Pseudonocardia sp.]|nr:nuclear transport factor 2 family protein [Pseudonocardia sp.]
MGLHRTDDEHPNADLVRRAHAAFKAGDAAAIAELFADDIVWTVSGTGPASGTTKGMDGVLRNFGDIMRWTEGTYNAEPIDYMGSDLHAANVSHVTARRPDGRVLDVDEVVVFTVRDGKLAEAQHMAYDEKAWDEFFA